MVEQEGGVYEFTPKAIQKEALSFLSQQLFTTPTWLINNEISSRTGENPQIVIGTRQESILNRIVSNNTFSKLFLMESTLGNNAYKATEVMDDLRRAIFSELYTKKATDVYRRNLQKMFTERVISLLPSSTPAVSTGGFGITFQITPSLSTKNTDTYSILKGTLRTLRNDIRTALPTVTDPMTKLHLQDLVDRITQAIEPK
jgi:Met-zincin